MATSDRDKCISITSMLSTANKRLKLMEQTTRKLADAQLRLEQRQITNEVIEQKVWDIDSFCNLREDGLNSARRCRKIRDLLDDIVSETQARLELALLEKQRAEDEADELRKQVKQLEKQLKQRKRGAA